MSWPSGRPAAGHKEQIERLQIYKAKRNQQLGHICTVDCSLGPRPKVSPLIEKLPLDSKLYSSQVMGNKLTVQRWLSDCFTSSLDHPYHPSGLCFGTWWENRGIEVFKDSEMLSEEEGNIIIKMLFKDWSK